MEQHGGGTTTTLGGIGTGYLYADWNGQIAYTTPNMNGLSATVGITAAMEFYCTCELHQTTSSGTTDEFGFQGQVSYSWTGDFAGKVWGGFFAQEVTGMTTPTGVTADDATAFEVGVSTTIMNVGLVAYGYSGDGVGTTGLLRRRF